MVFAGDDTSILIGQTLQLNAVDVNNSGFTSYQWSPATGLDNPGIQDPIATITADITYTVTATTPQGCAGTDTITIKAVNDVGHYRSKCVYAGWGEWAKMMF